MDLETLHTAVKPKRRLMRGDPRTGDLSSRMNLLDRKKSTRSTYPPSAASRPEFAANLVAAQHAK
jgi:hypothetical protein